MKAQLIKFFRGDSSSTAEFVFCGQKLASESVCHLGHILSRNLSDNADIVKRRARRQITCSIHLLHVILCQSRSCFRTFPCLCMGLLFGLARVRNSSHQQFQILRQCHIAPLHLLARISSVYNIIILARKLI